MKHIGKILTIVAFVAGIATSQSQVAGSYNYALSGSAVMRIAKPSALFLNPGELARVHSRELFLGTNRFSELPSISVSHFQPFVGTFAFGIGNEFGTSQYSFGYARIIGDLHTVGASLNYLKNNTSEVTLSFGTSVHFPDKEGKNSGMMAGLSMLNLTSNSPLNGERFNAGAGYWVLPNYLRLQGSWLYENKDSEFPFGAEYLVTPELAIQAGTESFEDFSCGVSYAVQTMNLDFAVGQQGISFGVNVRFGVDPQQMKERYYEEGIKAYDDVQYGDARVAFVNALEYDEYYEAARTYINLSEGVTETSSRVLLIEARKFEQEGKILQAKKNYVEILKTHPENSIVSNRLNGLKPQLHQMAVQYLSIADSLKNQGMFDAARNRYQLAFDYDSEDESILKNLSEMERMIADSVALYLTRGNARMEKNQFESAQIAFEQVLRYNSNNPEAKKNLAIIDSKLRTSADVIKTQRSTKEIFERGKSAFEQENYLEAINVFTEYLKQEPKNKDAQTYIDRSRDSLIPKVEEYFKIGLQYYVEENYKKALEVWTTALTIKPEHQAILEYKKRAELKMEALEKLR